MNSYVCEFCWKVSFDTNWELFGHIGRCYKRKELIEAKAFDIEFANEFVNENIPVWKPFALYQLALFIVMIGKKLKMNN
jgi:hypothetical protein